MALECVDTIHDREMEYLILATGALGRTGMTSTAIEAPRAIPPLRPHWPTELANVHSRTERIDMHTRACLYLVQRRGGLHELQDPDVAVIHALYVDAFFNCSDVLTAVP